MVLAALLLGTVAGVIHGEKRKTSTEVREEETVVISGVGVVS